MSGLLFFSSCSTLKVRNLNLSPSNRTPARATSQTCSESLHHFLESTKNLRSRDLGVEEELQALDDFWKISDPFEVRNPAGLKSILTYSTDSELSDQDVFRMLLKEPDLAAQLADQLIKVPLETLLSDLHLSQKQFQTFALRKGVSKTEKAYKPTDLNPDYFSFMFAKQKPSLPISTPISGEVILEPLLQKYLDLVAEALQRQQPKFHAHFDPLGPIEVSHKTFETTPLDFATTLQKHHKLFKFPMSHLHLGVESSQITTPQATAIGRAIEVQIIFDLIAQEAHPKNALAVSWGSTLGISNRGLVFVKAEAFSTTHGKAHDIELRQYNNLPHGLRILSFASFMAKDPEKIIVFEEVMQRGTKLDQFWGAAAGALKYVAKIIEANSQDPSLKKLTPELRRLSELAQESENIAPQVRKEIYQLIVSNNLVEKLRLNLFLRE